MIVRAVWTLFASDQSSRHEQMSDFRCTSTNTCPSYCAKCGLGQPLCFNWLGQRMEIKKGMLAAKIGESDCHAAAVLVISVIMMQTFKLIYSQNWE